MQLTQEQLHALITCTKVIKRKPKTDMVHERKYLRNDFTATCPDTGENFHIFIRQSAILSENFSIGLIWECKEEGKNITIFRCNGLHGGNKNVIYHNSCHIHTINLEGLAQDCFQKMDAEITAKFTLFSECLYYFGNHCNIIGLDQYFPCMKTFNLFEGN